MQIEGRDNDQEGTINSQIAYSILSQEPEGKQMFFIDEVTGKLYVKEDTLDREVPPSFLILWRTLEFLHLQNSQRLERIIKNFHLLCLADC